MESIELVVNKELDIAIYTPRGEVTCKEISDVINDYYGGALTKYVIWDFSDPGIINSITPAEVRLLAKLVSEKGKARRGGYDALITPDIVKYELARVFAAYTEIVGGDDGALKTVVFRKMDEALTWIRLDTKFVKSDWQPPRDLQI